MWPIGCWKMAFEKGREIRIPVRVLPTVGFTLPSTDTHGVLELASQAARLSVQSGKEHLMEIALDRHDSGRTEDYRPAMPLILHW